MTSNWEGTSPQEVAIELTEHTPRIVLSSGLVAVVQTNGHETLSHSIRVLEQWIPSVIVTHSGYTSRIPFLRSLDKSGGVFHISIQMDHFDDLLMLHFCMATLKLRFGDDISEARIMTGIAAGRTMSGEIPDMFII